MSNDLSYNNIRLLSLCAVLRLFYPELLRSLAEAPQDDIDSLLASDLVVLVDDSGSAYHLRADIQTDVLVRLHTAEPFDEMALHSHAFHYFLRQMQQLKVTGSQIYIEEECLYH